MNPIKFNFVATYENRYSLSQQFNLKPTFTFYQYLFNTGLHNHLHLIQVQFVALGSGSSAAVVARDSVARVAEVMAVAVLALVLVPVVHNLAVALALADYKQSPV